jgi:hypothetical protein
VIRSSETSVKFCRAALRYNTEDNVLHSHRCQEFKLTSSSSVVGFEALTAVPMKSIDFHQSTRRYIAKDGALQAVLLIERAIYTI